MRESSRHVEVLVEREADIPKMRESSRHVEVLVEREADIPKMRESSRFVEVVLHRTRNASEPGWRIGVISMTAP